MLHFDVVSVYVLLKQNAWLVNLQVQWKCGDWENSFPYFCAIFADEVVTSHGPIEADKENIRQEPYSLPQGFMWDTLDLSNADVVSRVFVLRQLNSKYILQKRYTECLCLFQLKELYTLLNENYVEDDDNMFRFDYSPSFLKW